MRSSTFLARTVPLAALAASIGLTSVAAASTEASTIPPPVSRIARELSGPGAKNVVVSASIGGKTYTATGGTLHPKPSQRFRVGSVTKTFTAAIVLQLVDEGKLRLGDTLEQHLPGVVPRGKEITIRHMLQMRSGLVNYTDYTDWLKDASASSATRPVDLLLFAASKPLAFDPGKAWRYSNTNYVALGLVIEQVTKRSYAEELERRLFEPLGLGDTELPQTRLLADLDDDGTLPIHPDLPKGDPAYAVDWASPVISWAAGGIVSSARDLTRFYAALLSGRVVSPGSLTQMKATIVVGPSWVYDGLGIFSSVTRCGRSWWHAGGILDYATLVTASERGERVGVVSVFGQTASFPPDESDLMCPARPLDRSAAQSRLVFARGQNLYSGNANGTRQRRVASSVWARRDVVGSPDGTAVAFVRDSDLHVSQADGTGTRRLARDASDPAWSPDGRKIVFVHARGRESDIYVVGVDGRARRRLTRTTEADEAPVWSPNGREIAFVRKIAFAGIGRTPGVGGNFEIFVMNADGSDQRRLTHEAARDHAPAWSPDGRRIVFERKLGLGGPGGAAAIYEVWALNRDGSRLRRLAQGGAAQPARLAQAARPLWSPNGRLIAYVRWSAESTSYDLYAMNADGSGQTNVTRSRGSESWFAWSPARP